MCLCRVFKIDVDVATITITDTITLETKNAIQMGLLLELGAEVGGWAYNTYSTVHPSKNVSQLSADRI